MGVLDGLNAAPMFENGQFLTADNRYLLEVQRLLVKNTRKSGMCFIAECTVLQSTCDKDPVGAKRSWLQKLSPADVAFPALKGFMYALLGYDFTGADKEFCIKNIDPELTKDDGKGIVDVGTSTANPFKGRKIAVDTVGITTVGKGLPFTRHNWQPADTKLA